MFQETLKAAMVEKGMSQAELAQMSGVPKSSISQYLAGKTTPSMERKTELASAMGLEENFFDEADELTVIESFSPLEVSRRLKKSVGFVYQGLQQGVFPWGYAVQMTSGEWNYFINAEKFRRIEELKGE